MRAKRQTWLGCSIIAGLAISAAAFVSQTPADAPSLDSVVTDSRPLQAEIQTLASHIDLWIDQHDPLARQNSMALASELSRLVREDDLYEEAASQKSAATMIVSLQFGLRALKIQDRLILLAEQGVRRTESAEAVSRLFRAHERREEIITQMVLPAIAVLDHQPKPPDLDTQLAGI